MQTLSDMPNRRPNLLLFFTDQQRWDCMAAHGNPLGLTPNLDRLAQRGTFLQHFYSCQPVCGPARSCLQSGQWATRTDCFTNGRPLRSQDQHLGPLFDAAGYDTGYIGKWHLGEHGVHGPVAPEYRRGYRFWLAANALEHTSDAYHTTVWDENGKPVYLPGYRVDALTDAGIRFINRPREAPWFLTLSFLEPHHQNHADNYPAPEGYEAQYQGRWTPPDLEALRGSAPQHLGGYWGMIKRLDEALGRILDSLRSTDQLEDTVIAFVTDHGCHFKTRNGEYKRSCHDASLRLPGVLYGGPFMAGGTRPELTSLLDIPPTLLEVAGIDIPDTMDGRSLLPLVDPTREPLAREHIYAQISEAEVGRCVRTHRWKYGIVDPDAGDGWAAFPKEKYREAYLYDLENDPHELCNLIGLETFAAVANHMRERLLTSMWDAGEPLYPIEPASRGPAGQRMPEI